MRSRAIFTFVLLAAGLWMILHQYSRVTRSRAELKKMTAEISALESEGSRLRVEINSLQEELRRESIAAEFARAAESNAKVEFVAMSSESQWAEPPEALPEWNPASPFVWVSKGILAQIPMEPFSKNGELNRGVAEVLGINSETRRELDQFMAAELERFRNLELTNVFLSTNHLPGVNEIEGRKMTIELRPPVEAGAQFSERLTALMASKLGPQRAGILMEQGKQWFAKSVSTFEPKVISVGWHPNKGYRFAIKGAGTWKSFGGLSGLQGHLPDHLLPFFADLAEVQPENE
ncbi:MAG: hypothetical protein SFY81_13315 [Verrucomicrobiota bacterium]|nr:hypothetical protein [Verrucomicrobiota bacterium]